MKYLVIFLVLIGILALIIPQASADNGHVTFIVDGYPITINTNKVTGIYLDWNSDNIIVLFQ